MRSEKIFWSDAIRDRDIIINNYADTRCVFPLHEAIHKSVSSFSVAES